MRINGSGAERDYAYNNRISGERKVAVVAFSLIKVAAELVKMTLRYGNRGTLRRIGKHLEMECADERLLRRSEKALRPSSSLVPWIPTRPKRGMTDRRWGVVVDDG